MQSAAKTSCMCSGPALVPPTELCCSASCPDPLDSPALHTQLTPNRVLGLGRAGTQEAIQQAIQLAQQAQGMHEQGQLQQPAPEAEVQPQDNPLNPEQAPAIAASPPADAGPVAEQQPEVGRHWLSSVLCSA